jgi:flagellar biosynthesis protein FlhF
MQVKRFIAADMRRALEMVRQDLGPDAIILSSNRVPEGVELLTTLGSDSELAQLQQQPFGRLNSSSSAPLLSDGAFAGGLARSLEPTRSTPVLTKLPDHPNAGKTGKELVDEIERARQKMLMTKKAEDSAKELFTGNNMKVNAGIPRSEMTSSKSSFSNAMSKVETVTDSKKSAQKNTQKPLTAAERYPLVDDHSLDFSEDNSAQIADLQADIADMRFLLEQQLERLTGVTTQKSDSPVMTSVMRRLERLGLPQEAIAKISEKVRKHKTVNEAWPDALANLAHQLPIQGRDIVDQGGVFAFVGPTGVGKTTTIGKLAARYVLQHGADKVALITTDTYRIAAHDQLRSLARILRVPVRVVNESQSLESLLKSLRHCSLILIDTAGFRHGDPHLKMQLESLVALRQIKTYLVMSSNSQAQMLKASVHAYGVANLQGCVLTKLDETASLGEALGVVLQSGLPVAYTTDGQDIPKNIEVAKAHQLVAKAVSLLKTNSVSILSSN